MLLKRSISNIGLFSTSLGCMLGSGWLFGAYYAAQTAGAASVWSWVIGGVMIIFIAFIFAELSTMLPLTGGIARFSQFSHGSITSFCISWLAWLSCVSVAPTEVQALLQYLSHYLPWLMHKIEGVHVLTSSGFMLAALLLFLISSINTMAIHVLSRYNSGLAFWKLVIPIVVITILASQRFHIGNFHYTSSPHQLHDIFWALPTAGIIFSFLGFREATSLAGEAKNPQKAIPLAVIGSVLICTLLYVAIQVVFIAGLDHQHLQNGWKHLQFIGDNGPFAGLAMSLGLGWLVLLIYIDAVISPLGSALIYTTTTARLTYAMSVNRQIPLCLQYLNTKRVPVTAVFLNFIVGLLLFLPFPGWQALVSFQSVAIVFAYGMGPLSLLALRQQLPHVERPFKLPWHKVMCILTFYICNLLTYWTGWQTLLRLMISLLIGVILFTIYECRYRHTKEHLGLKNLIWLLPYTATLLIISYCGNFGGGKGWIPFGWDFACIAILSVATPFFAQRYRLDQSITKQLTDQYYPDTNTLLTR